MLREPAGVAAARSGARSGARVRGARHRPRAVGRRSRARAAVLWLERCRGAAARDPGGDAHRAVARSASPAAFHRARQPFRERSAIMRAMRSRCLFLLSCWPRRSVRRRPAPLTEAGFSRHARRRGRTCACPIAASTASRVSFEAFSQAMRETGVNADVDRAADGTAITLTVRKRRGGDLCPSPYPPVDRAAAVRPA